MAKLIYVLLLPVLLISCDKEEILPVGKYPSEIVEYVALHFPDNPIIQVEKDKDGLKLTYEVWLEGSFKLEFNRKKEVIEIKGTTELPSSTIPSKILAYVSEFYPENFIVGWELDDGFQEVKLDNSIELVFTLKGDFLRID